MPSTARRPALDELIAGCGHPSADCAASFSLFEVHGVVLRLPRRRHLTAETDDGVGQPLKVHVLPPQHLLVGVVRVVISDRTRVHLTRLNEVEDVRDRTLEEGEQLGRGHEACFALQVIQTRVQGMAWSRASAIGSPQSRQMP